MRRAFRALGFNAWSCDIEPADDASVFHLQQDVTPLLDEQWDLLIGHPVCKRLANSGAKHLYFGMRKENGIDPAKWAELEQGAEFYLRFRRSRARRKAIENPVMHAHAAKLIGGRATQFVQPWWFGEPFFKATGFELHELPKLAATNKLTPPRPGTIEHKSWSAIHRMPPGPDCARRRSETFPGIAAAAAHQWGALL